MVGFRGGAGLERALRQLEAKVKKGAAVRVGFLEGATYPDGTSVALVAAANNFGTRTIPPRPFFTNMVAEKQAGWPKSFGKVLRLNDYDVNLSLKQMGEGIAGQLRASILATNAPPLAESTVAAKGFKKPLIDTSNMINSIATEVIGA